MLDEATKAKFRPIPPEVNAVQRVTELEAQLKTVQTERDFLALRVRDLVEDKQKMCVELNELRAKIGMARK